jgi:hypothetical protein
VALIAGVELDLTTCVDEHADNNQPLQASASNAGVYRFKVVMSLCPCIQ